MTMRKPPRRAGYFMRLRPIIANLRADIGPDYHPSELVELTRAELRTVEATQGPMLARYERVDASRAHNHVKRGGWHDTGLYVDYDGRIRYAEGEAA